MTPHLLEFVLRKKARRLGLQAVRGASSRVDAVEVPAESAASKHDGLAGAVEDPAVAAVAAVFNEHATDRFVASRRAMKPDAARAIKRFHRTYDSHVRFMAHDGEGLEAVGDAIRSLVPYTVGELGDRLAQDAYFTINAFWRGGTHKAEDLRYLNSAFVDMDCFHESSGLTPSAAIALVDEAQFRNVIPPASLIVNSGRGIWCFWHLLDEKTLEPPRAFAESTIPLYRAINGELQRRLADFSPALMVDRGAGDPSRLCRILGSTNSKASGGDREVRFWVQADQNGRGFVYTLRNLAAFIEARPADRRTPARSGVRMPTRRAGWLERWRRPLRDFWSLEEMRGGFRDGTRENAAFVLAYILRKLGADETKVRAEALALAKRCRPRLSEREAEHAINGSRSATAHRLAHMADATIARLLTVTDAEARRLRPAKAEPPRTRAKRLRRDAVRFLVESCSTRLTVRGLQSELGTRGFKASLDTINADLAFLGLGCLGYVLRRGTAGWGSLPNSKGYPYKIG